MTGQPERFGVSLPEAKLETIRNRLHGFDWDAFPDAGGWTAGLDKATMRRFAGYWLDGFDWRAQEEQLNRWSHYRVPVDGVQLHYIHVRGSGPSGRPPVLLLHGWPSSFIEYLEAAERLAWPERFGGDPADGRDVVIPSLPGYGLSGRPPAPIGPRRVAAMLDRLMRETLGYERYLAQGADWGSIIAAWIGHDHPASCIGLHVKLASIKVRGVRAETPEEGNWQDRVRKLSELETGYSAIQATRPQTLGFSLADSPIGAAAWILEKFAAWSDLPRRDGAPDLEAVYSLDTLLTNVMLYVATDAMVPSTWLYFGAREEGSRELVHHVEVPTGVAVFRDPVFPTPPRSMAERSFAVRRWTVMDKGGHFPALEVPESFAEDVRQFADSLA